MESMPVTYLEMNDPGELIPARDVEAQLRLDPVESRDWRFNRRLYREVGADWHWTDKEDWSDSQWREYAADPTVHTHAATIREDLVGYLELVCSAHEVQLNYFGLLPEFIGRGYGGQLLTMAIRLAWALEPQRVWLHTCDLDHPAALANYRARGMTVFDIRE